MSDYFIRSHLTITQKEYAMGRMVDACYMEDQLLFIEEVNPTYNLFTLLLNRVGGPWKWPMRYSHKKQENYWRELVNDKNTRLFVLRKEGRPIGFCCAGDVRDEYKAVVSKRYQNDVAKEIIYFGLFIEETGKGYGQYFLSQLFEKLMLDSNVVYLNTRSTNHARVVPFYEKMGMKLIYQEQVLSDIESAETYKEAIAV